MKDLEETFGEGQVLETVETEIEQLEPLGKGASGSGNCNLGDEDLAAVSGSHDPCCPVHRRAEVVPCPLL